MNKKIVFSVLATSLLAAILYKVSSKKIVATPVANKKQTSTAIFSNTISQQEADALVSKINKVYQDATAKYGGMTADSNTIKNQLVAELAKGGYQIVGGKAVLK